LDPIKYLNVKAIIYMVTFVLRIAGDVVFYVCRHRGSISRPIYLFVQYSYLVHLNLFKMIYIEISFISLRTIFHSSNMPVYNFWAIVTMVFLAYDFCEITLLAVTRKGLKEATEGAENKSKPSELSV
jgi:hypothetical protein